jgi:hypothetical protein
MPHNMPNSQHRLLLCLMLTEVAAAQLVLDLQGRPPSQVEQMAVSLEYDLVWLRHTLPRLVDAVAEDHPLADIGALVPRAEQLLDGLLESKTTAA